MSRRVYAYSPHVTPYNDYLFREISRQLDGLTVIYRARALKSHPWKSAPIEGYTHRFGRNVLGIDWGAVLLPLTDARALFWIAGWDSATGFAALTLSRLLRRDYVVWTDTPNPDRKRGLLRSWLRRRWVKWIFTGARAVMSTGEPGVQAVLELGAPVAKTVNFPFVLEIAKYARSSRNRDAGVPMKFVSSGRVLNWLKGHDVAIRAFARAASRCSVPFEYIVAGTGPDLDSLKSLAAELGIADRVQCIGWTEAADLQAILRNSDVLVHPSPVHDPFPNAVLEGMAAGMAVLGSAVCGSVIDRVAHGEGGFIHEAGDWEGLSSQIESCLRQPDLVETMGRSNARIAESWPVERSVDIIRELAAGRFPAIARKPWPKGSAEPAIGRSEISSEWRNATHPVPRDGN
jgi:glycosyltransferase involved in cell wall biosynthesis